MTNEAAASLGSKGGQADTEAQRRARQRNMYIALSKRHPNSTKIWAKLVELGVIVPVPNEGEREDK